MFVQEVEGGNGYIIARYTNYGEMVTMFITNEDSEKLVELLAAHVQDRLRREVEAQEQILRESS